MLMIMTMINIYLTLFTRTTRDVSLRKGSVSSATRRNKRLAGEFSGRVLPEIVSSTHSPALPQPAAIQKRIVPLQEEEEKKRATKELFEMEIQSDVAHPSGQKEAEAP